MSKKENSNPRTSPKLGWECHWTSMSTDQEYSEEDFQQVLDLLREDPEYSSIPMQMDSSGEFVISSNYEMEVGMGNDDDGMVQSVGEHLSMLPLPRIGSIVSVAFDAGTLGEQEFGAGLYDGEVIAVNDGDLPGTFKITVVFKEDGYCDEYIYPSADVTMKAAADEEVARTGNASRTVVKVNLGRKPFGDNLIAMLPLSYANHGENIPVSAHGAARGGRRNHGKSIIATHQTHHSTDPPHTNSLTRHASSDLDMEASHSASIPDRAAVSQSNSVPGNAHLVSSATQPSGLRQKRSRRPNVRLNDYDLSVGQDKDENPVAVEDQEEFKLDADGVEEFDDPTEEEEDEYDDTKVSNSATKRRKVSKNNKEFFEKMFQKLVEYKRENHHCLVPAKYEANPQLGNWVHNTRREKRNGTLSKGREERLNKLGFDWGTSQDEQFEEHFQELVEFERENHHCLVPAIYEANPQLGTWVNTIRYAKRNGRLSEDREKRLDKIGFVYEVQDEQFEKMFQKLVGFKQKFGHCIVPAIYEANPQLGNWVHYQRQLKREGRLKEDREKRLNEIGFVWDARAYFWDKNYHKLCRFKEENNGRMNVKFSEDPELHRWMANQRELERLRNDEDERMLTKERFDKLDKIGFRWYDKKREPNRKVHRVEWKLMHEILELLEQRGETFFLLDRVYGSKTKYRPDGVVHCINLGSTSIIIEVDEKAHDSYSPANEQARMKALKDAAAEKGFNNAVFIRINTGNWTEVSEAQVDTVNDVLTGIFADKPEGYHVYYVDYDDDHVHVQESEKTESGIRLVKKFHTEGFDPKATRNKS